MDERDADLRGTLQRELAAKQVVPQLSQAEHQLRQQQQRDDVQVLSLDTPVYHGLGKEGEHHAEASCPTIRTVMLFVEVVFGHGE